jgi:hypothetical protein
MTVDEKIARLESFKDLVLSWERSYEDAGLRAQLRSAINQEKNWVRQEVIEANCFKAVTIAPPPAIGGLVMNRADPFMMLFDVPYGLSLVEVVVDMVEETIGVLRSAPVHIDAIQSEPLVREETVRGYAFIAMPMTDDRHDFDDVHDAIKEAAQRCGIQAERVDEPHSTERITDRILESIRRAEYVICDLTEAKPNVYFEAGYAHALRKTPIYIAREGTRLEFDLKDYPVIFFKGLRQLKDTLERRLRGIDSKRVSG